MLMYLVHLFLPQDTCVLRQNPTFLRVLVEDTIGPASASYKKVKAKVGHRSCLIIDFSEQSFGHEEMSSKAV